MLLMSLDQMKLHIILLWERAPLRNKIAVFKFPTLQAIFTTELNLLLTKNQFHFILMEFSHLVQHKSKYFKKFSRLFNRLLTAKMYAFLLMDKQVPAKRIRWKVPIVIFYLMSRWIYILWVVYCQEQRILLLKNAKECLNIVMTR